MGPHSPTDDHDIRLLQEVDGSLAGFDMEHGDMEQLVAMLNRRSRIIHEIVCGPLDAAAIEAIQRSGENGEQIASRLSALRQRLSADMFLMGRFGASGQDVVNDITGYSG